MPDTWVWRVAENQAPDPAKTFLNQDKNQKPTRVDILVIVTEE